MRIGKRRHPAVLAAGMRKIAAEPEGPIVPIKASHQIDRQTDFVYIREKLP
jgi:hypothetical protein